MAGSFFENTGLFVLKNGRSPGLLESKLLFVEDPIAFNFSISLIAFPKLDSAFFIFFLNEAHSEQAAVLLSAEARISSCITRVDPVFFIESGGRWLENTLLVF